MPTISGFCTWVSKQGLVLVSLFALVLTALLVVQQQRTIDSQRVLIQQLFSDSQQLTQMKIHAIAQHRPVRN